MSGERCVRIFELIIEYDSDNKTPIHRQMISIEDIIKEEKKKNAGGDH